MSLLLLFRPSLTIPAQVSAGSYPGPVPKRKAISRAEAKRRKRKKEEREILFWLLLEDLMDGQDY